MYIYYAAKQKIGEGIKNEIQGRMTLPRKSGFSPLVLVGIGARGICGRVFGAPMGAGIYARHRGGWCAGGLRSVAAAFACEMGVFCGEVRLKISVLGVFLAVEWVSKYDWCEDLLIFFRKSFGSIVLFLLY